MTKLYDNKIDKNLLRQQEQESNAPIKTVTSAISNISPVDFTGSAENDTSILVSPNFNNNTENSITIIESQPVYSEILDCDVTDHRYSIEARKLRKAGKFEEGIALMNEATIEHFPTSPRLLKHLGLLLARKGQHDEAFAVFDQALEYVTSDKEEEIIISAVRGVKGDIKRENRQEKNYQRQLLPKVA